jgi:hypothetical protein
MSNLNAGLHPDPRHEAALADGTTIGDHFLVRRKLGGGGMGEVYLVDNLNVPGKKHAIKLLRRELSGDPRFVELLREEAAKQSRLESDDNVVGVVDFFEWNGRHCLLQNYVDGLTLAQMLEQHPKGLALDTVLTLMQGVLSGLDHAHALGILHCDVKPANVIVDRDGRPRVTDFGISRDIGAAAEAHGLAGAGTAEYMSPEQVQRPHEIDHRCDVFSAGVMCFEMLCGQLPFPVDAARPQAPLLQLRHDAPDVRRFRPDVPEAVARIVATALQRDPAARFQGCADFRQAIADHRRRERWRRTWLPALAVAGVLAVIGVVALQQWRAHVQQQVQAEQARVRQERAALLVRMRGVAGEAVHNAAQSLNLMCREAVEYALKAPFVAKAREAGLADTARDFERKLADMRENMQRHAADYTGSLQRLGQADEAIVGEALAAQVGGEGASARLAGFVRTDDAAQRRGTALPTPDQLLQRCPPPPGG